MELVQTKNEFQLFGYDNSKLLLGNKKKPLKANQDSYEKTEDP